VFDMGGTTAKICLIDHGEPQHSRSFTEGAAVPFLKAAACRCGIPSSRW